VLKHSLGELGVGLYAALHVIASTPNFTHANQSYASLLADDVLEGGPLPYRAGTLAVPERPGIGVGLDAARVERYAELYEREGQRFGFHDTAAMGPTPLLPKR
jgi:L-Ala-D/L-Glu epimerase